MATTIKKSTFVQFGVLSETEILKFCVIPITKVFTREMTDLDGTIYDDKLGVIEGNKNCITCGLDDNGCPGHFGYIALEEPVYNFKYMTHVKNILTCVCWQCGECRLSPSLYQKKMPPSLHRLFRQRQLIKLCKTTTECPNVDCKSILRACKIDKTDGGRLKYKKEICAADDDSKETTTKKGCELIDITAAKAYKILIKISEKTMKMMGYNEDLAPNSVFYTDDVVDETSKVHIHATKATSFLFTILPVLPPCARPWSIKNDVRNDDKITPLYNDILNINYKLKNAKAGKTRGRKKMNQKDQIEELTKLLEININSLIDNHKDRADAKFFTKRLPHISLRDRIEKKKGRIQSNVNGKHTDFCARNVIASGNTIIRSGYIGVPEDSMRKLTIPETVADYNYSYLSDLIHAGGAENVVRNGQVIVLAWVTKGYTIPYILRNGDMVERHLQNGDYILFGRQPTLRQESMIAMQVERTLSHPLRPPLSVCTPLNADYDGDECHFQVPQSIMARAECKYILNYENKIITPQKNNPIIGLIQDSLVALYMLSQDEKISRHFAYNLVMSIGVFTHIEERRLCLENLQKVVKRFLPLDKQEDFMHRIICSAYPLQRKLCGSFEKIVGEDYLFPRDTKIEKGDCFSRWQSVLQRAQPWYPDMIYDEKGKFKKIGNCIDGKIILSILFPEDLYFEKSSDIGAQLNPPKPLVKIQNGILLPDSAPLDKKMVGVSGNSIISLLSANYSTLAATRFIAEAEQLSYSYLTSRSLSMGIADCMISDDHKEKISFAIQEAKTKCQFISENEEDKDLKENKINAELNSLMNIGTSLANTGMEKNPNSMNTMRLAGAKGSVINCSQISAFVGQQNVDGERAKMSIRGERAIASQIPRDEGPEARAFIKSCYMDGLNPSEFFFHAQAGRRGIVDTGLKTSETGYASKKMVKKLDDYKVWIDGTVRNASKHIIQFLYGGDGFDCSKLCATSSSNTPLFCDIISLAKAMGKNQGKKISVSKIETFLSTLKVGQPGFQTEVHTHSAANLRIILRPLLKSIRLPDQKVNPFLAKLKDLFEKSKVCYGEMVGLSAASSITEPTIQMVLSSFHNTGLGTKDISVGGVPRMKEILGANAKPSVCSSTFHLNDTALDLCVAEIKDLSEKMKKEKDPSILNLIREKKVRCIEICEKFGKGIEKLMLKDVCKKSEMLFLAGEEDSTPQDFPFDICPVVEWKSHWWSCFFEVPQVTSWVLSLEMDVEKLFLHSLELDQIKNILLEVYEDEFVQILDIHISPNRQGLIEIFFSKSNILDVSKVDTRNHDYFVCKNELLPLILNTKVKGINGIEKTYIREDMVNKDFVIDAKGTCFLDLLNHPSTEKCVSNNMWDIYQTLGVEATRSYLMEEFMRIISFDNNYVNPHHIELLVDSMLVYGTITSVKSSGIGREVGPLCKGLFEKNVENFSHSAAFCEADSLESLASNVMLGLPSKVGVGNVSVANEDPMEFKKRCFGETGN